MNMQTNLNINETFRSLIPPLSDQELAGLEADVKQFGCQSPLTVWNGTLIDGHHRYAICKKHGLPFKTEERQFEDEIAVKRWMIKNQFSRRNLPLHVRLDLAFVDEELEREEAKKRQLSNLKQFQVTENECNTDSSPVNERDDELEKGRTLEKIASKAECSHQTAFQYKKVKEAGLAERVVNGESIKKVYDDMRREKARDELHQSLESIEAKEAKALAGVYDVIVIDPPWPMQRIERDCAPTEVDFDYPTMPLTDIKDVSIPTADDCHVFLWTTQKFLRPSFEILEAWGLTYVCLFTWMKNGGFQPFNMPQFNTEFILYAHKGNPKFVDLKQFNCGFQADRGRHSEKPEVFYDVIRRVTGGRRLDMFNRRKIDGFDGWGKEAV